MPGKEKIKPNEIVQPTVENVPSGFSKNAGNINLDLKTYVSVTSLSANLIAIINLRIFQHCKMSKFIFSPVLIIIIINLKISTSHQTYNQSDRLLPFTPEVKSIVLPHDRAKFIRGCTDCSSNRTSNGVKACVSAGCKPVGTRCSQISEFSKGFITASSHHCRQKTSGERGTSLFCCEKGSKEGMNNQAKIGL